MAAIALPLSLALTVLLWRVDRKRKGSLSWEALVPFTVFAIALSRNPSRWFAFGGPVSSGSISELMEEGNVIDRVVFALLLCFGILALMRRKEAITRIMIENPTLTVLYFYCLLSITWSEFAFVSFKRIIKDLACPVAVMVVATETCPIQTFKTIIRRNMYLLAPLSIVLIKYFPAIGRTHSMAGDYMITGVATAKNPLGMLCLVGSLVFVADLFDFYKKKYYNKTQVAAELCTLIMLLYLLVLANSMTNFLCLIIASSIILSSFLQKHIVKILVLVALLYLSGIVDTLTSELYETVGRNPTLTGRTGVWEAVLRMQTNPLTGAGYGAFWAGDRLNELFKIFVNAKQAHNGYIEVYLNLGFIGLFLILLTLHSAYRRIIAKRCQYMSFLPFSIGFLTIFIIHNITEASFLLISPLWFIFLFISMSSGSFSPDSSGAIRDC